VWFFSFLAAPSFLLLLFPWQ
jgi:hypothetical protein